jgi:hypothetical protein
MMSCLQSRQAGTGISLISPRKVIKRYLPLLFVVAALSGCKNLGGTPIVGDPDLVYEVEAEWSPLKWIRQRPDMVSKFGASESVIATVARSAYVANLQEWLNDHPPGSATYRGKMAHEQVHSSRQGVLGAFLWIARYSYDLKFMWREEAAGWYAEIQELRRLGQVINVIGMALTISKYRNLVGRMISFDDAKKWIEAVLRGEWEPED